LTQKINKCIIHTYAKESVKKEILGKDMQPIVSQKHFNISKQIALVPSYWSIICDDSQERIGVQETKV